MTAAVAVAAGMVRSWSPDSLMLFQEDLSNVVAIFRGSEAGSTVVLGDEERTYSSFDELRRLKGDDVAEFFLSNEAIGVRLTLKKAERKATLMATKSSDAAELAYFRAREFLETKRKPATFWVGTALPLIAWSVLLLSLRPAYEYRNVPGVVALGILLLIGIPILALVLTSELKNQTRYFVTLKRKHEHPSFFRRKKDDLILMLIGSIVGAVLGIMGTLAVQHLLR